MAAAPNILKYRTNSKNIKHACTQALPCCTSACNFPRRPYTGSDKRISYFHGHHLQLITYINVCSLPSNPAFPTCHAHISTHLSIPLLSLGYSTGPLCGLSDEVQNKERKKVASVTEISLIHSPFRYNTCL